MSDNTPLILVNPPPLGTLDTPGLKKLEEAGYRLWRNETGVTLTSHELCKRLPEAVAVLGGLETYSDDIMALSPNLKTIARFGVGFDNVDLEAAKTRGIEVTISPGANTQSVSDVVMALMTSLACSILPNHAEVMAGGWKKTKFPGLYGSTLGIIGFGRIGQAVAKRAEAFGMKILSYDPYNTNVPSATPIDQVIAQADVLTLHVPAVDKPILDAAAIATIKRGAIVINAARGGLLDETALAEALHDGRLGGAGLDVFAEEPLGDSPLRSAPNVILTPHIAGVSASATAIMADMCAVSLLACLSGNEVPQERLIVPRPT
ncbi:phosphoglycerate dehydrogenase [Pararhizobium sp. IMCC21322]|uniref:phosphoglycerate dehydrogenase n=1 Tax=Pararhizobium sp. IMCC21322 TaxID=3067903 RepID=UPI0027427DC7|nr:phosphoglycerate dehydrogenase [Pararhizobium sp. IMCC21322]